MSFNWSEYYYLAENLVGRRTRRFSQEARIRASISRAYYACLIKARNYLRDRENIIFPSDNSLHIFIINQFRSRSGRDFKRIARSLDRLRLLRNFADYQDTLVDPSNKSVEALGIARLTITQIDRL